MKKLPTYTFCIIGKPAGTTVDNHHMTIDIMSKTLNGAIKKAYQMYDIEQFCEIR